MIIDPEAARTWPSHAAHHALTTLIRQQLIDGLTVDQISQALAIASARFLPKSPQRRTIEEMDRRWREA